MVDKAYWLADADGSWNTGSNWATQVPGSTPATYTATVPSGAYDVSITPYDPVAGMATGTSPFSLTYNTADTITSLEGPAFATLAIQGGTLTVTTTLTAAGAITMAAGTFDIQNGGGATSSIGGGLSQSGGTLKVDAGTLNITGASSIAGTVAGAGTVTIGGGGTIASGAKVSVARLVVGTGGTTLTLGGNLAYAGAFKQQGGTTLALTGGYMLLTGTANLSGATINGSKVFYAEGSGAIGGGLTIGGTVTVFNTKTMSQAGGTVTVGDTSSSVATLSNAAGAFYVITDDSGLARGAATGSRIVNKGAFRKTGGTGTSTVSASFLDTGTVAVTTGSLSFTGPSNSFAGAITGAGTVQFGGGSTVLGSGTTASVATLTLAGASTTVTVAEDLTYAGTFTQGVGSTLGIAAGDTLTLMGTTSLSGRVIGAGTLAFGGGTATIGTGAAFSVANMAVTGSATNLVLNRSLTYAGHYSQSGGATLTLSNNQLALTGSASFNNTVVNNVGDAVATVYAAGTTTITGLDLSGSFTALAVTGAVTQSGGDLKPSDISQAVLITPQGTYDIIDDSDIIAADKLAGILLNGLLEKTGGSGVSTIDNEIITRRAGSGTIVVASGTLELGSGVSGNIQMNINDNSTLMLDDVAGGGSQTAVTTTFVGNNATLQLNDAQGYFGAIGGFGATKTLDLRSIGFGSGITTTIGYAGSATSGMLTVSDGTRTASLLMLGNFSESNFHLDTDGHGGSAITFA